MGRIIEISDMGKPKLTKFGLAVPEFKVLKEIDHTVEKESFKSQVSYIFFVYDKESPYYHIIPLRDRQERVLRDKLPGCPLKDFEESQKVFDAINKFRYLEYTVNERVFEQCRKKFGEFQLLWSDTAVSHENYKDISKEFDNVYDLFNKLEKLQKIVEKDEREGTKNYGDYKPSLLETGALDI